MNFIFIFCFILQFKYGILQENGATDQWDILPNISQVNLSTEEEVAFKIPANQKCEPRLRICDNFQYFGHVVCKKMYKALPNISTHFFDLKETLSLTFTDTTFLPARSFFGICIQDLTLNDPDAIVDENVFEGTIRLVKYNVERSSIKVIYLLILRLLKLFIYRMTPPVVDIIQVVDKIFKILRQSLR